MDYLEIFCSVGGMAIVLYVFASLVVRTWNKNSLKTRLLGDLYKVAPPKSNRPDSKNDTELVNIKQPLSFGYFSDIIFNLCSVRSRYRGMAVKTLESELDILNII